MKNIKILLISSIMMAGVFSSYAQNNGIAKSLGLFVFPNDSQDSTQQNTDEASCYQWAMDQTGYNPMNPPEVVGNTVDTSPDGSAIRGSARGAAGGAAIGAIAGDTGKGAAIGAVAGGIRGRRAKKANDQKQQQANNAAASAKSDELLDDYKRAFSVCMEAKGYTIK
jgi:hypothetical protein